jgi:hypothetical protein
MIAAVSDRFWQDARLSVESKAALGYFHSRPAGADIRVMEVRETLRVGAERMRRVMRELVAAGYVKLSRGRAGARSYYILAADVPAGATAAVNFSALEKSCAASPARGAK